MLYGTPSLTETWLIDHSQLYGVLYPILLRARPLQRALLNRLRANDRPVFYEEHYAANPDVPGYAARWAALEQVVLLMDEKAANSGTCFGTFMIPDITAVYPEVARSYYLGFDLLGDHWQVDKQERALEAFSTAHAIPLLVLRESFSEVAEAGGEPLYLEANRHWSAAGHAAAADFIYAWLIAEGLVPMVDSQAVRCGAD